MPQETPQEYLDAARRCSDTVALHMAAHGENAVGKWIAIRLSDGGSDDRLYASKSEAVRFQLHENQCAYVCIHPSGRMPVEDALSFLATNRKLYDAGMRLADPETHIHTPMRREFS